MKVVNFTTGFILRWFFWKQAEVVNTKLSLLLDHLLSKEKTRPEFCKNEFSVTGANDVASNTFFSTSVAAARQDWEMDALFPLSADVTRLR